MLSQNAKSYVKSNRREDTRQKNRRYNNHVKLYDSKKSLSLMAKSYVFGFNSSTDPLKYLRQTKTSKMRFSNKMKNNSKSLDLEQEQKQKLKQGGKRISNKNAMTNNSFFKINKSNRSKNWTIKTNTKPEFFDSMIQFYKNQHQSYKTEKNFFTKKKNFKIKRNKKRQKSVATTHILHDSGLPQKIKKLLVYKQSKKKQEYFFEDQRQTTEELRRLIKEEVDYLKITEYSNMDIKRLYESFKPCYYINKSKSKKENWQENKTIECSALNEFLQLTLKAVKEKFDPFMVEQSVSDSSKQIALYNSLKKSNMEKILEFCNERFFKAAPDEFSNLVRNLMNEKEKMRRREMEKIHQHGIKLEGYLKVKAKEEERSMFNDEKFLPESKPWQRFTKILKE